MASVVRRMDATRQSAYHECTLLKQIHRGVAPLVLLFILASARSSRAKEVSFDEAISMAANAPSVEVAIGELSIRETSDNALPSNRGPLTLSVAPGRRLSPDAEAGTEVSVGVMQGWNLSDLAKHTGRAARAERAVLAAEVRTRALASKIDVAGRWFQLHQADAALVLVRDELAVVADLETTTTKANEAGLVTSVAEAEARAAHAEAKRLERVLEGERVGAALALSAALGLAPDFDLRTTGPLPAPNLPSPSEVVAVSKRVEQLPMVALLRLQSVAASARAAEARANQGRTIGFGVTAQRESTGSKLLFGSLQLTLPGSNRGQRQEAVSRAEARRSLLEADSVVVALRAEMAEAIHELEHSEELWLLTTTELLPASEELLRRRTRELELGEGTSLEVLRARAGLLSAKRLAVESSVERRWAQVHVWLLLAEILVAEEEGKSK